MEDFESLKAKARSIPKVKEYLDSNENNIVFTEMTRQELFYQIKNLETTLLHLAGIYQNEMIIEENHRKEFYETIEYIRNQLNEVESNFTHYAAKSNSF